MIDIRLAYMTAGVKNGGSTCILILRSMPDGLIVGAGGAPPQSLCTWLACWYGTHTYMYTLRGGQRLAACESMQLAGLRCLRPHVQGSPLSRSQDTAMCSYRAPPSEQHAYAQSGVGWLCWWNLVPYYTPNKACCTPDIHHALHKSQPDQTRHFNMCYHSGVIAWNAQRIIEEKKRRNKGRRVLLV